MLLLGMQSSNRHYRNCMETVVDSALSVRCRVARAPLDAFDAVLFTHRAMNAPSRTRGARRCAVLNTPFAMVGRKVASRR